MGMLGSSWRGSVAAVAAVALVCIAMTAVSMSNRRVEMLQDGGEDSQANFKAVGDVGCLGRKCELTDDASRKDLNDFFGKFLNHGQHAGHHSRSFGLAPRHVRLSSKEGMADLQDFYGKQKSGVTAKVRRFEALSSSQLDQYEDNASRSDMNSFYDTLPGHGKRKGVVHEERRAEKIAKQHQLKALAAAQESHRRMSAQHKETEEQATRDHERFHKEAKQQLELQKAGHKMEAVPSSPRTKASERRAENRYYQELQVEAKEQKAKNALRHEDKEADKQAHHLSAEAAKDDMDKWYADLDSKVKKTARVVKAEQEAAAGVAKAKGFEEKRKVVARDSGAAVKSKRISHAEAERADAAYFKTLDAAVHKTKVVRDAEAEASGARAHALSAEEARKELFGAEAEPVHKTSTVKKAEAEAKQGFEKMKKVAATDNTKVPVAVADTKLSRKAALEEQNSYFASLDKAVHKSAAIVAAEKAAAAGKKRRSLSAEEARKQLFAN